VDRRVRGDKAIVERKALRWPGGEARSASKWHSPETASFGSGEVAREVPRVDERKRGKKGVA
jgi:hypothetical protein